MSDFTLMFLAAATRTLCLWSLVCPRTVLRSSSLCITPTAISLLSAAWSGQGYNVARKPSQIFLTLDLSCSPWKKMTKTDFRTSAPVLGSSSASSISAWRRKTFPRQARHSMRSKAGRRSRRMTPATKPSWSPPPAEAPPSSWMSCWCCPTCWSIWSCSSKNCCVFLRMCLSSVSSRKFFLSCSAFWLTSCSSCSSFSKVASKSIISLGCGASGESGVSSIGSSSFLISRSRNLSFLSISSQRRTSLTNLRWKALVSGLRSLNWTRPSSPSSETQA